MCYALLHILLCMYYIVIISCESIIARLVDNKTAISTYSMLIVSAYLIGRQPDINVFICKHKKSIVYIWRKSFYSLGQTIYYNWGTYVYMIQMTLSLVVTTSTHFYERCQTKRDVWNFRFEKRRDSFSVHPSVWPSVKPYPCQMHISGLLY